MPDGFTVDNSELDRLVAALSQVPINAGRYVRAAVEVSARNVKDDWKKQLEGSERIPSGPRTIGYDVSVFEGFGSSVLKAEIGPEQDKPAGALVGMLEYGTPTTGPTGYGHGALQKNQPDFEKGLDAALKDAERILDGNNSLGKSVSDVFKGRIA